MVGAGNYRTVGEVMKGGSPSVHPDTPFKTVVRTMDNANVSAVPVVDDRNHLLGMVTESDVLLKEAWGPQPEAGLFERWWRREEFEKADATTAGEMMSQIASVRQDLPAWEAARVMYDADAVRLPVVDDDDAYLGIVSWRDLIRSFLRDDDEIRDDIMEQMVGTGMVSDPNAVTVAVQDGVVTVTGQVDSDDIIDVLVDMIRNLSGVVEIDAQLSARVDRDAAARIATELTQTRPDR